jgi:hypothetical protein
LLGRRLHKLQQQLGRRREVLAASLLASRVGLGGNLWAVQLARALVISEGLSLSHGETHNA